MNKTQMISSIVEELVNRGYDATYQQINKNGVPLETVILKSKGGNIAPVIYLDGILKDSSCVEKAVETVIDTANNYADLDFDPVKLLNDKTFVMDHLRIGLQREISQEYIHKDTEFDGIVSYLFVNGSGWTVKVTEGLLTSLNVDESEAWKRAEKNTFADTKITPMATILSDLVGTDLPETDFNCNLFVISNSEGRLGSSAVLDHGSIRSFFKGVCDKLFMLPSSIHECLLVPADDRAGDISELSAMVKSINESEVDPMEQLADICYVINL